MVPPAVVVVMGVSGSGKSTIGARLAERLGWTFADGDDFHSDANIAKMHAGVPLTDDDRRPWLDAIARWIDDARRSGGHGVVACSALKRRYRNVLIGNRADVRLVYLAGGERTIAQRLAGRRGHFMPAALLRSQFEQLEEPLPDEHPIVVPIDAEPDVIVARIVSALNAAAGPPP